jgi:hypothetical protein
MIIGSLGPATNTAPNGSNASSGGDKRKRVCAHRAPRCIPDGSQKHRIDGPITWIVLASETSPINDVGLCRRLSLVNFDCPSSLGYVGVCLAPAYHWLRLDDACWAITG